MYNCPEMLEALYASFKLGCAVVPINFRLHPKEFSFIIDHAGARAVIASAEFNEALAQRREQMPEARHLITTAETTGELLDYETLLAAEVGGREDADVEPEGPAWLFYTSGTTGEPKGVILTHRNLLAMSMGFCADICPGLCEKDVILHAAPLSHGSGLWALPNIAMAANKVILTTERIIDNAQIRRVPDRTRIPFFTVDAVVEVPFGCAPHECYGTYEPFFDHMGQYAKQVSIDPVTGAADYLRHYYQEPATWEAYLERVGTTEILDASRRGRSVYDD